jgi:hypothetical protein
MPKSLFLRFYSFSLSFQLHFASMNKKSEAFVPHFCDMTDRHNPRLFISIPLSPTHTLPALISFYELNKSFLNEKFIMAFESPSLNESGQARRNGSSRIVKRLFFYP